MGYIDTYTITHQLIVINSPFSQEQCQSRILIQSHRIFAALSQDLQDQLFLYGLIIR